LTPKNKKLIFLNISTKRKFEELEFTKPFLASNLKIFGLVRNEASFKDFFIKKQSYKKTRLVCFYLFYLLFFTNLWTKKTPVIYSKMNYN